jgi:hypothetical protein
MKMSIAPPWEVLLGAPTAITTEVDEDINGAPPWEVLPRALTAATTKVDEDVDDGPLRGA